MPQQQFAFGPYRLQPRVPRLTREGVDLPLGRRALQVLGLLVQQAGQLVTKEELHAAVWGPIVVEDANLHVQVSRLRKLLGNDAIATVPRLGYRFMWPVQAGLAENAAGAGASVAASRRLSVIVLPFVEPNAPRGQEYFADAITDDITTVLARIRGSYVICASTAFTFKGESVDVPTLAREMGVRYVLRGRVDRSAGDLELNARLTEAATGAVIWSDRLAVPMADQRRLRLEVVGRLAAALDLALYRSEAERSAPVGIAQPEVVDLLMRGRALGAASCTREQYAASAALFEQAWRRDPDNQQTLVWRAMGRLILNNWPGPEIDSVLADCERDLEKALRLDTDDGYVYHALAFLRQQQLRFDEAMECNRRAIELVPGCVHVLTSRATLATLTGQAEGAIDDAERALMLSPRDPQQWLMYVLRGRALLLLGKPGPALPCLAHAHLLSPFWGTTVVLAAAHAHLGQVERARELWRQLAPEDFAHMRWARGSDHPVFLRQRDEHVLRPLIDCGLLPRPAAANEPAANEAGAGGHSWAPD